MSLKGQFMGVMYLCTLNLLWTVLLYSSKIYLLPCACGTFHDFHLSTCILLPKTCMTQQQGDNCLGILYTNHVEGTGGSDQSAWAFRPRDQKVGNGLGLRGISAKLVVFVIKSESGSNINITFCSPLCLCCCTMYVPNIVTASLVRCLRVVFPQGKWPLSSQKKRRAPRRANKDATSGSGGSRWRSPAESRSSPSRPRTRRRIPLPSGDPLLRRFRPLRPRALPSPCPPRCTSSRRPRPPRQRSVQA